MNNPIFSIIVPIYKVEQYLPKCIDSILNQSFTNFELLLIDDGSPDFSGKICDKYAQKDSRIRVFHKENEGVSSARNFGIDNAIGEYFWFIDSDDWIDQHSLEIIVSHIKKDILQIGFSNFTDNRMEQIHIPFYNDHDNYKTYYNKKIYKPCLWSFIIKKSLINSYNIRFSNHIKIAEDQEFILKCILVSDNIACISNNLYFYRIRDNSTMRSSTKYTNNKDNILVTSNIYEFISSNHIDKKSYKYKLISECCVNLTKCFLNNTLKNRTKKYELELFNRIYKQTHTLYNNNLGNSLILYLTSVNINLYFYLYKLNLMINFLKRHLNNK